MSDTLENTNRETKRETKHTHIHCLGHQGGLAAATVQVRSSKLRGRVAPSAAPSAHRARRGMGGGGYARTVSAADHCPPLLSGGTRKKIIASHFQLRTKQLGVVSFSDLY